ncbi:MAG: 50S ribosomal protein L25/general stress protein Ctc [Holosporales bacterium]|jgi:large subunit ribosomal protein L25|nr:50S ribosomal protein L25/general stress protein Ctc [Holosporales bacterium]
MSDFGILSASAKIRAGTGPARSVRRDAQVPCIIYGKGVQPQMCALDEKTVQQQCSHSDFFSKVLTLAVGDEHIDVLPKVVQYHPVTDRPLHVDFIRVSASSEIKVSVPVEFIHEDKSPAIKLGAILNVVQRSVHVLCSPRCIPDKFEIDLTGAAVGATFTVENIQIPDGVSLHSSTSKGAILANVVQSGKEKSDASAEPGA